MASAQILIHPTLACSPASMACWQHQHRMLIVLAHDKAQAVPHPIHARPTQQVTSWTGGDAA